MDESDETSSSLTNSKIWEDAALDFSIFSLQLADFVNKSGQTQLRCAP